MDELNVGIVGLGRVAGIHIETFKKVVGANVTAICSRRKHNESELQKKYEIPLKAYTNYDEMLAKPDIHIIDICTQHSFHAMQAIAAAEAKKHIIIEKPICLTYDVARTLRDAIRKTDANVCVCFECRYSDHFSMIRSIIDNGLLGNLHYGEVDYYHEIGPRYTQYGWNVKKESGGSSLLTAGCHSLDALLFFMDGTVEEVTSYSIGSKGKNFEPYEYDTTSVTILKFHDKEKIAKVTSCIDSPQPYYFHIHLIGSEGSLLDNRFYSAKLKGM
ncbi:MAG: Gfo/Idh/MocA family protein, partial [Nitrosopumilaceae archaeon]